MFLLEIRNYVAIFVLLSIGAHCIHASDCEISFQLYTPHNRAHPAELEVTPNASIARTYFDARRPTRIFIHGYNSWQKIISDFADAYLMKGDYNFIAVGNAKLILFHCDVSNQIGKYSV